MDKKITLSIISTIIIIIILAIIFFLQPQTDQETNDAISAQNFSEQIQTDINESTKNLYFNLKSFNSGDEIKIRDTINSIRYQNDFNYTAIEFNVDTNTSEGQHINAIEFDFKGNLTDIYKKNDDVQIKFTIKHVTFTYEDWKYDCEVYAEGWDQNYYIAHSFSQVLPQTCIILV